MSRQDRFIAVSLLDTYHELGEYSAKFIIDPAVSPSMESVEVSMRNADGLAMPHSFRRWGTKLTVSFSVTPETPDGVSTVEIVGTGRDISCRQRFFFWVIKP